MESLGIFFFLVFVLVGVVVYWTLGRQNTSVQNDEAVPVFSTWNDYQSQNSGERNIQNFIREQQDLFPVERFANWLKRRWAKSFRAPVDYETEVLFFAMQFMMYMESGMTVMSALQKTQTAMEAAEYSMASDLQKINFKLRSGVPFAEAIHAMEGKNVKLVKDFFLVISQAQAIGVAVSDALKGAIKEFEELRIINAEQKAARLSVLMAVPIILGFLPAIMILVLAPAVHGLFKAFW